MKLGLPEPNIISTKPNYFLFSQLAFYRKIGIRDVDMCRAGNSYIAI